MTGWWKGAVLVGILLVSQARSDARPPSDPAFEAVARQGIDHVYNLEFEKAETEFQTLVRMNPGHPAGYFF